MIVRRTGERPIGRSGIGGSGGSDVGEGVTGVAGITDVAGVELSSGEIGCGVVMDVAGEETGKLGEGDGATGMADPVITGSEVGALRISSSCSNTPIALPFQH